ncbi:MAG: tetratricopeptide repeat protein [Prevotella sp.]|nr:tetratricopeptide repeat protein [Prevotella sp.]
MFTRTLYIFILGVLLISCNQIQQGSSQTAARCLEEAEDALANDSIRLGETLLRKTIRLAEKSEDWHTHYIAYQRLAKALSQSNPEEALRLMKKALTIYEQHPDDEHNYVILLDYAGTYATQVAFINEGSFDEALNFIHRAYDIARKNQMTDQMCQTLTSLANIAWAKEDYRQAVNYARQAESILPPSGEDRGGLADLRLGTLQVLARSYLDLNMLDSAETVYRQIEPGDDVHLAYIVQSNLAKIALRRMGAIKVEDDIDDAFDQIEDFYYKALEQKDQYYQETLRQEMKNQQLEYRSKMYARTLLIILIASLIVIMAIVMVLRYRMQAQRQEKRQLQQEAEHQKTLLHQANEVVAFLQDFILERTEVLKKLNQSGEERIILSPHEWSEIERTLNAIDNNRFANLREQYPKIQEDDIRLCILTRLGISNRTIGNIYCITISAVQHRKLKLKKDVFGETNPDITLEQLLNSK